MTQVYDMTMLETNCSQK